MVSNMITGDRRWAPTRKLTVLGKVPKPINLPSQRLENHGLDPNVEIVPKGTLTWGSRPSLAAPNAWGSSSVLSPHTDGSAGSPSHRPSCGGSGTPPSTAGSDRSHEPVSDAMGPNSCPSSASGILASSQISTAATRPRSVETRPNSSQLSRFADNSVDSIVAWGPAETAERLGTVSSKSTGFALSSGDFPSLGSDKNSDTHSQRGLSSQGRPHSSQGCPTSASGTDSKPKEFLEPQVAGNRNIDYSDRGTVHTWKADDPPCAGHGASPNMENWHRDLHLAPPYPNTNMPPPHYDSWHNPSFCPADGSWYKGGAAGSPYRSPGLPGSHPIDYPHVRARPLSNPQFPRQDAGPGGFYHNSCEAYYPYMPPERFMSPGHPDIPVRPGPYPGPVPYDFYNSTERGTSIMGMVRPVVHNQYPTQHQHSDSLNFHTRHGGYSTVVNKEHMKPNQAHETQGQYRVLLKQHDGSEDRDEQEEREHSVTAGSPHLERGNHPIGSSQKGDGETKSQTQEAAVSPSLPGEAVPSQSTSGMDGQSTGIIARNLVADSSKTADDGLVRRAKAVNVQSHDLQQYPVIKKNVTLMEKVESLNNNAHIADSRSEGVPISSKEKSTCSEDVTAKADRFTKVVCDSANSAENVAPTLNMETANSNELNALIEDTNQESIIDGKVLSASLNSAAGGENSHFVGQKKVHGAKSIDHRAKLRSNRHDNDEWMKKPSESESSMDTTRTSVKGGALESDASKETSEKQELHPEVGDGDGTHTTSSLDPVDHNAQRAKMKERAIQRAKQLQQEEEERIREQKAKALAKLEELNRRTLLADSSNLRLDRAPPQSGEVQNNNQESGSGATPTADTISVEASNGTSACHSEAMKQEEDSGIKEPGRTTDLSSNVSAQASHPSIQSSVVPQTQSLSIGQVTNATTKITLGTITDIHHNTMAKQKQVGYRKRHSTPQENNTGGRQKISGGIRAPKDTGEIVTGASNIDTLPNNEDPPVQHKKRSNRIARNNNNKLDEGLTSSPLPSPPHTEGNTDKLHIQSGKTNNSTSVAEAISVPSGSPNGTVGTLSSREVPGMPVNDKMFETTEETGDRVSNHWKPHPHQKTTRNQQANKPVSKYHATETVMWAPVKPLSKCETSDEVSQNSVTEATKPTGKSGPDLQNGLKAKRAEIERYVPKPVAKELSKQVKSQQISPSLSHASSGDVTGKSAIGSPSVESARLEGPKGGKSVAGSDTINVVNHKHNKHERTNASWCQWSSAESPSNEGSMSSDQAKTAQKTSDQLQTSNIDNLLKGQLAHTDNGWNDNDNVLPGESVTSTVVSKSYGASRQRRQPYKVHSASGSNYPASDNIDLQQGIMDKSEQTSPALEGRHATRTESQNAGIENIKPHWQPKSQAYSHSQQGNRGSRGGQMGASNEDNNTSIQRTIIPEAREARHQDSRRESKIAIDPEKVQTTAELAPPNVGCLREQAVSLGVNQRGQYNGRSQRGFATNYRGRDLAQDASKQNFHMNGDKRKNNPHVEYQRVGSYDKPTNPFQQNPNAGEGVHEASRAPGSRSRERGRHFSQGGGQFYGRSTAAASDSYDRGE